MHTLSPVDARIREATGRKLPDVRKLTNIPDDLATKMRSLIENMMIRGKDYRAELDVFDSSFTGAVPQADFRDCLQGILTAFLIIHCHSFHNYLYHSPSTLSYSIPSITPFSLFHHTFLYTRTYQRCFVIISSTNHQIDSVRH